MKSLSKSRKQNGVGLIEILIVLVVLVIAWAAIAALQGTLMTGSAVTKARNEALGLAREKTEELRTTIEKGQYDAALADTAGNFTPDSDNPINGVNAQFTRSWLLDDWNIDGLGDDEDYAKKLTMQVSWVNNEGVTENVVLNSMITYSDKQAIASFATGGTGDANGTTIPNNNTASEGPGTVDPNSTPVVDEVGDGDSSTDDAIYTAYDNDGNLVVYQGAAVNGVFLNGLTVYGGKIIKIAGTIYYNSPEPYVQATSPAFCASFARTKALCGIDEGSPTNCAEYVCYAGGDCKNGGEGCDVFTQAQLDALPDLNGGWWGKVGDFFPTLENATQFPTICTGDSINVAARLYVTKRQFADPVIVDEEVLNTGIEREGINTSFDCQNVMISEPNDTACTSMIEELTGYEIQIDPNNDSIEDHQVIRELSANDTNVVLAATNNFNDNGVFSNFCTNEIPPVTDTYYEYECTCNWNKQLSIVESVIGLRSDGVEQTGCCEIPAPGCEGNLPDPIPNNLKQFTYSCSTDPDWVPEPIITGY
jgi:type II secretory pathway pseudopilin PulG